MERIRYLNLIGILFVVILFSGLVSGSNNLVVKSRTLNNKISVGQEVPIQITVTNEGNSEKQVEIIVQIPSNIDVTGTYLFESVGSTLVSSISVPPKSSRTVSFTIMSNEPGNYTLPVITKSGDSEVLTKISFSVIGNRKDNKDIGDIKVNIQVNINHNNNLHTRK